MDPNANVQERITLLKQDTWTREDVDRLEELHDAYNEWRSMGGFPADIALLEELQVTLREAANRRILGRNR